VAQQNTGAAAVRDSVSHSQKGTIACNNQAAHAQTNQVDFARTAAADAGNGETASSQSRTNGTGTVIRWCVGEVSQH